ncbi:hypothetical protein J2X61_006346 [Bacillus sp. 3255]|nr:hypothetical protein [Bacillus sp. 3255]
MRGPLFCWPEPGAAVAQAACTVACQRLRTGCVYGLRARRLCTGCVHGFRAHRLRAQVTPIGYVLRLSGADACICLSDTGCLNKLRA